MLLCGSWRRAGISRSFSALPATAALQNCKVHTHKGDGYRRHGGFCGKNDIDLTVVAPDDPLAMGMVDALQAAGKRAFGPTAAAALIEASKGFSKQLMKNTVFPRRIIEF